MNMTGKYNRKPGIKLFITTLVLSSLISGSVYSQSPPPVPSSVLPPEKASKDDKRKEIFSISRRARSAESAGLLEKALSLWREVLELKPNDYSAFRGTKRCLTDLERYDEALRFITEYQKQAEAGKINFDPASLSADMVEILFASGDELAARTAAEGALRRYKGYDGIYIDIAAVYSMQRLGDEAVEILQRGRKECKNRHLFARDLARYAESRMDWETAVDEYLLYLEEQPHRLNYVTGAIGDICAIHSADSIAVGVLEARVKSARGKYANTLRKLLATVHFKMQRYELALEQYKLLDSESLEKGGELLEFAEMLEEEREYKLAKEAFEELIMSNPHPGARARALLGDGRIFEQTGFPDSAYTVYEQILTPGSPPATVFEAYRRLGLLELSRRNNPKKARQRYEDALEIGRKTKLSQDELENLYVEIAMTWAAEGNLEKAERDLSKLIRSPRYKSKASSTARIELTRLAFLRGDVEEAHNRALSLIQVDPSSEYANDALELAALINDMKDQPEALKALGRSEYEQFFGRKEAARQILDSLSVSGDTRLNEEALWRIYRLDLEGSQYTTALSTLQRLIKLGSSALRPDLALERAGVLCEDFLSDDSLAVEYFEQLLIDYPESPLADNVRKRLKALTEITS